MKTKVPVVIIGIAILLVLLSQLWPVSGPTLVPGLFATNTSALIAAAPGRTETFAFVVGSADGGRPSGTQKFLIRAVGPGLKKINVTGTADDPSLTVNLPTPITVNDWSADPANRAACEEAAVRCGAFALDEGSKDAAVVVEVGAGPHSVQVTLASGAGGTVLIEIYRVP
jgi:hypothetical protein